MAFRNTGWSTRTPTATVVTLGEDGFETAAIYGKGQTLTSPILPGFAVNLDDLF